MSYTVRNLVIALGLALVGVVLATSYIRSQKASITHGQDRVTVLVAKKDIPSGTKASVLAEEGFVEEKEVLREDAAPMPIGDIKDVKNLSLMSTVYAGEQLTGHKFERKSSLNPTDQIKGTERLMTVKLTPQGGVATYVTPGDHIDVYANVKTDDGFASVVVARDVIVWQTPDSMLPDSQQAAEPAEPLHAGDDPRLFGVQASDKVVQQLLWGYANANEKELFFALRPAEGDQETKLPPRVGTADVS